MSVWEGDLQPCRGVFPSAYKLWGKVPETRHHNTVSLKNKGVFRLVPSCDGVKLISSLVAVEGADLSGGDLQGAQDKPSLPSNSLSLMLLGFSLCFSHCGI